MTYGRGFFISLIVSIVRRPDEPGSQSSRFRRRRSPVQETRRGDAPWAIQLATKTTWSGDDVVMLNAFKDPPIKAETTESIVVEARIENPARSRIAPGAIALSPSRAIAVNREMSRPFRPGSVPSRVQTIDE